MLFGMQALHVSALFCSSCIMETELGSACGPLKTVPRSGGEPTTARWCERCSFVRTESSSNGATVSWSMDLSLLNGDNRVGLCWEGGKETRWRLLHHPPRSSGEGRGAVSIWVGFDMTCLAANGLYSLYGLPSQKKRESLWALIRSSLRTSRGEKSPRRASPSNSHEAKSRLALPSSSCWPHPQQFCRTRSSERAVTQRICAGLLSTPAGVAWYCTIWISK
jgi:hypothetical protein